VITKVASKVIDLDATPIDAVAIDERIARLNARSLKRQAKVKLLKLAYAMMDLTTLEGKDTEGRVRQLCVKARQRVPEIPDLPNVAAVCVYPTFVAVAKSELEGTSIRVASVATAFPSGLASLNERVEETRRAVEAGADEIDMVISRGRLLEGDVSFVYEEIAAVKAACGAAHLKVILETGELGSLSAVRRASDLAMEAGADFIKTSTGKVQPAATLPVTAVMLEAIRDYFYRTGRRVGMKPAGGIQTSKDAMQYLVLLHETLGNDWMTPDLFRFGASKLANDIQMQLLKEVTGRYQNPDYFSKD
jgi:deoxyribose-phosphate aldolase